ncbi:uncharacterized protein Z520_00354 [Fonsecaea multimorphosa CBS 102226]|uniref:H/ACA ribonucleoprotein complex non-core subunit NAF1 n=1 Tax=Fonsecaea multimorphosa CBS 102226 TaxID=1442371 RepID=A0A0D2KC06_9EURO|nr:uncharacterized protein Z520_00354 [Fonsecaea multimorphosa CBS 102226]KIY03663.1 hypothetical protein Z520_00354 [Fonsecaea multimorphosa CBS 102226]OAL32362.1 hypothetical protein AYO22_00384 [Fonsecaea multimorphosa]
MDAEDFPKSPAKRQRTGSPDENRSTLDPPTSTSAAEQNDPITEQPPVDQSVATAEPQPEPEREPEREPETSFTSLENRKEQSISAQPDSNSLLDALMLQVEAEAAATKPSSDPATSTNGTLPVTDGMLVDGEHNSSKDGGHVAQVHTTEPVTTTQESAPDASVPDDVEAMDVTDTVAQAHPIDPAPTIQEPAQHVFVPRDVEAMEVTETVVIDSNTHQGNIAQVAPDTNASIHTVGNAADAPAVVNLHSTDAVLPNDSGAPEPGAEGAEWEVDSSPYESSSDSDSDTSDDTSSEEDSDEDADGDYAMLDPEETARILMQGDAGSDDEGGGPRDRKEGGPLRTANERTEEVIPKPDITVTENMKIEELGNTEFVVESTVVVKAKTSGEYQVLEPGSLICRRDRSVVGVVADLIGRVEEPRYTIRFTNDDDIRAAGLSETGTTVFYVPEHSTFVFTQPLKSVKGSDASNFHDEEVGEDEMEFSDDEAEAEHKRQMKAKRQGRSLDTGRGRGNSKFARGPHRGGGRGGGHQADHRHRKPSDGSAYGNGSLEMNYDDVSVPDTGDDGYTPLQRPTELTEMIAKGEQPQERGMMHPLPPPPQSSHFRGGESGGRGRGYGHGRGGRGGFRPQRGRGGFNQPREPPPFGQYNASHGTHQNGYNPSSSAPLPNLNVPTTPSITPQNITYPPMTPSPITPLPNVPFNFGQGFQPPTNFPSFAAPLGMPPPPPPQLFPGANFSYQQQQQQQPGQYHLQGGQNHYGSKPHTGGQQTNYLSGAWASNPAIAAALQRQVEEQRRTQGQGQGQ